MRLHVSKADVLLLLSGHFVLKSPETLSEIPQLFKHVGVFNVSVDLEKLQPKSPDYLSLLSLNHSPTDLSGQSLVHVGGGAASAAKMENS